MTTKFDISVKWQNDENPDLSWLGEYKSKRPEVAYVDRKNNLLVVPSKDVEETFNTESDCLDKSQALDEIEVSNWTEDDLTTLHHPYFQELPFDCRFERNDFQYIETCNYPKPEEDEYRYIIQDVKELEDYNNNQWYMRGCIVTASLNGIELGSSSLWGLSSTMTESEDEDVVKDLTAEATEQAEENLKMLKVA
jgi:hypothetical protein